MHGTRVGVEDGAVAAAPASQWGLALVRGAWLLLALVLETFAQTARDVVDLERVSAALQETVEEALQPASVAILFKLASEPRDM